jgi:hypothetical protein
VTWDWNRYPPGVVNSTQQSSMAVRRMTTSWAYGAETSAGTRPPLASVTAGPFPAGNVCVGGWIGIDRFARVAMAGAAGCVVSGFASGRWLPAAVDAVPELRMLVLGCSPATLG